MDFKLGGMLGYTLLKALSIRPSRLDPHAPSQAGPDGAAKLQRFLGSDAWREFEGRSVLDLGCGEGAEAVAVALAGAAHVYGTDVQPARLTAARHLAARQGVADRCTFLHADEDRDQIQALAGQIDCAFSLDAFEHFAQPEAILATFHRLLAPGGKLLISFGPPWKNPYGSHMRFFNRWPWIHLLFREETVMAVRSLYRQDWARRYQDVEGGLNRMTVARFRQLIRESPFDVEQFRAVPLSSRFVNSRALWTRLCALPPWREYLTSVVLCTLVKRHVAANREVSNEHVLAASGVD